ncbi:MAG: class I SAM-dependent methyltransferase [Deltaproteobacteria bacterium]
MRDWLIAIKPGGRIFGYLYDKDREIMRCNPLPTKEELGYWYGNNFNYEWFEKRRFLKKVQAWHRWRRVKKYIKDIKSGGSVLDIGCGNGLFLDFARGNGCTTYGSEFESPASVAARNAGHGIYNGDFLDIDFNSKRFDIITLWHSLEHFIDPGAVLDKAHQLLTDNGVLIIAVPNLSCLGVALKDIEWVWIQQPFVHIWHWKPTSLSDLLRQHGFEVGHLLTLDTWDANRLYDGYCGPMLERVIYYAGRKCDLFIRKLCCTNFDFFEGKVSFIIVETARLFLYLFYRLYNGFRAYTGDGSEIFITATKSRKW